MTDHEDALDELRTYARNSITDKTINALVKRIKAGFTLHAAQVAEVENLKAVMRACLSNPAIMVHAPHNFTKQCKKP